MPPLFQRTIFFCLVLPARRPLASILPRAAEEGCTTGELVAAPTPEAQHAAQAVGSQAVMEPQPARGAPVRPEQAVVAALLQVPKVVAAFRQELRVHVPACRGIRQYSGLLRVSRFAVPWLQELWLQDFAAAQSPAWFQH